MDDPPDRGYSRAPELEDLLSLCAALNREGARYLLIGGFAVILHGYVRGTKDIDLLVDTSPENVQAVKRALSTLPDNAVAAVADDEIGKYQVVRVADEVVVDHGGGLRHRLRTGGGRGHRAPGRRRRLDPRREQAPVDPHEADGPRQRPS